MSLVLLRVTAFASDLPADIALARVTQDAHTKEILFALTRAYIGRRGLNAMVTHSSFRENTLGAGEETRKPIAYIQEFEGRSYFWIADSRQSTQKDLKICIRGGVVLCTGSGESM